MTSSDDTDNVSNMSYFRPALLTTESEEDFKKVFDMLWRDVAPENFVQSIHLRDFAVHDWDVIRYSRAKAGIINNAFRAALVNVLRPVLLPAGAASPAYMLKAHSSAEDVAWDWLFSQEGKDRVLALLEEAGLGMWAVEAEALRSRLEDIERLDRLLTAAEAARDKALRSIAWYSERFAEKLRQSSERILAAEGVPSIVPSALAN